MTVILAIYGAVRLSLYLMLEHFHCPRRALYMWLPPSFTPFLPMPADCQSLLTAMELTLDSPWIFWDCLLSWQLLFCHLLLQKLTSVIINSIITLLPQGVLALNYMYLTRQFGNDINTD